MNRHLAITIGATLLLLAGCSTTEAPTAALPDAIQLEPSSIASIAIQERKLIASDADEGDFFGISVALSGDTALIGANGDEDRGSPSGSAYVFTREPNGTWTQTAKLTAIDGAEGDFFGRSVALSGDTALIGANGDDDEGANSGSAYVFTRDADGNWTQTAKLTAIDGAEGDQFGRSVALSGDTALVSAPTDDDDGLDSGSAYVFTRDADGNWSEPTKLTASDAAAADLFGISVALNGDTAVIGAVGDDASSGSAYVFRRDADGNWSEPTKLTASDAAAADLFGISVALNGDTALIGAHRDDDRGLDSGSTYVFTRDANGTWSESTKLTASDADASDLFGISLALSGVTALIGAQGDSNFSGSAYVFTRDANGTSWTQTTKLTASDADARDLFGISVALSSGTALIGAHLDDDNSGSAYAYQLLTPEQSIQNLIADVDALAASGILKRGQARGLTRPLENALRSLARNNTPAACSQLADFITEVEEKTPRPLPQPEADTLITSTDAIRAALGCTTSQ